MAIQLAVPLTIPEKVADKVWVLGLNIIATSTALPVKVVITVAPYVSATGEILKDQSKQIVIPDLYAAASTDAVLAQGVGAIYQVVEKLVNDQNLFS